MRLDVDSYLTRRFDLARQNCWHVLRDAWLDLTGDDLGDRTPARITTAALIGQFDSDVPTFRKLDGPAEPSIVLMTHARLVPHVGLYWRRKVLQMASGGPSYLPLAAATAGYDVAFYVPQERRQ